MYIYWITWLGGVNRRQVLLGSGVVEPPDTMRWHAIAAQKPVSTITPDANNVTFVG